MGASLALSTLVALNAFPGPLALEPAAAAGDGVLPPMSPELVSRLALTPADAALEALVLLDHAVTTADLSAARAAGLGITPPLRSLPVFAVRGTPAAVRDYLGSGGVAWAEWNAPLAPGLDTARTATLSESVTANLPGIGGPLTVGGQVVDGSGVGIAIVDGGVDATHPDLPWGSKVQQNLNFVCSTPGLIEVSTEYCFGNWELAGEPAGHPVCGDPLWVDAPTSDHSSGHGTHVAGIAAGSGASSGGLFRGVAPGATLYGFGAGEAIAILFATEAFDWILCNGASLSPPIKVINNSWGTPPSTTGCTPPAGYDQPETGVTRLLVDMLVAQGVTVVFSSGNSAGTGAVTCNSPQSRIPTPGVIGVANYDDDSRGTQQSTLDASSSRGLSNPARADTWPDISAPGADISSTMSRTGHTVNAPGVFSLPEPRFSPNYVSLSGTSMAAPHLSGIVALMKQANPALTPAQIENILEDTAYKYSAPTAPGPYLFDPANADDTSSFDKGHGLADARAAVQTAAALASVTLGDTSPQPPIDGGERFFLRTTPTGLGNADLDYFGWSATAPSKTAPSAWHDVEPLTNFDAFWIPATILHGDVDLVNTDVKLRFWAGSAAANTGAAPPAWEVNLMIGPTVLTAIATGTGPATLPKQYDVVFPGVTAAGTSLKVVWDSAFINTNLGNALLYDSVFFPTSIGLGVEPAAAADPATLAHQVCILERPGTCFPTIQLAVDNAFPGETAQAGPGTYLESVLLNKDVTVESLVGPAATTILGQGGDAVRLTAAGATLRGFTVDTTELSASAALARIEAPDGSLEGNTFAYPPGLSAATSGAGGGSIVGNAIAGLRGLTLAGSGDTSVAGNVVAVDVLGLHALPGVGPVTASGNQFRDAPTQVLDDAGTLDLNAIFEDNSFDRAVGVTASPIDTAIYGSIQAAIDAAGAGDTVIVKAGTYPENLAIPAGKDGLTVCSTPGPVACSDAPEATIVDGTGPDIVAVASHDVTLRGLTLQHAGPAAVTIIGVNLLDGSGVSLLRNVIRLEGGTCAFDGSGCSGANMRGVLAGGAVSGARFEDNLLFAVPSADGTEGGTTGILGAFPGGVFEGNVVQNWAVAGLEISDDGLAVSGNAFTNDGAGVRLCPSSSSSVLGNAFTDTTRAVVLCEGSDANEVHGNLLGLSNDRGLVLEDASPGTPDGLTVHAELNCWGVETLSGVEGRIDDPGASNDIHVVPFLDADCATPVLPPVASFTADPTPTDRLTPVQFADTSDPGGRPIASEAWDFGDGTTASGPAPTHTFSSLGDFTVTLTVTNEAELSDTATLVVTVVNLPPTAAFSFMPDPANRADPTMFRDESADLDGAVVARHWDFGDGNTSDAANPMHTFGALGTFPVTLTVTDNDGDSDTATVDVTVVNLLPLVAFSTNPDPPVALLPTLFDDGSADRDGTVDAWHWDFGDGATSDEQNPIHLFLESGMFPVTLTVTDNDGGVASLTRTVLVCPAGGVNVGVGTDPPTVHEEICIRL